VGRRGPRGVPPRDGERSRALPPGGARGRPGAGARLPGGGRSHDRTPVVSARRRPAAAALLRQRRPRRGRGPSSAPLHQPGGERGARGRGDAGRQPRGRRPRCARRRPGRLHPEEATAPRGVRRGRASHPLALPGNGRRLRPALRPGRGGGMTRPTDPLFTDDRVSVATLRERAWNHRWAVQADGVIPLTAADPDFPVADEILEGMREYLRPGYLSYGPPEGLPALRAAVARRFRERRGIECSEDQVLATNGAASALYLVAQRTLAPGDEALVADPCDFL